jgi:hypothetical protein
MAFFFFFFSILFNFIRMRRVEFRRAAVKAGVSSSFLPHLAAPTPRTISLYGKWLRIACNRT